MKSRLFRIITVALLFSVIFFPAECFSQKHNAVIRKYLTGLPSGLPDDDGIIRKYRMTTVYTNRDLYGTFTGKLKVTGDYTKGLGNNMVSWSNVFIDDWDNESGSFTQGVKQNYMENMSYVPSSEMLGNDAFKNFPASTESVFARNLVWDMMSIETFAWDYSDSLQLNCRYTIPEISGEFNMSDIGTYEHTGIQLCWTGISLMNNEMCAVIEYRAIDNKIKLAMEQLNSRGTEQYWGTIWISLKSRQIEYAEMYSGTIQELEVKGLEDKFIGKTIRELWVEKIK